MTKLRQKWHMRAQVCSVVASFRFLQLLAAAGLRRVKRLQYSRVSLASLLSGRRQWFPCLQDRREASWAEGRRWYAALLLLSSAMSGCGDAPLSGTSVPPSPPIDRPEDILPISSLDANKVFERDFGEVMSGEVVSNLFSFRNGMKVPIRVLEGGIRPDCGCTTFELSAKELQPDEVGSVQVKLDTRGKAGPVSVGGVIQWGATDDTTVQVRFRLKAEVSPVLTIAPATVAFRAHEITTTKRIRIAASLPVDWSTLRFTTDSRYIHVEHGEVERDGVHAKVSVVLPADEGSGLPADIGSGAFHVTASADVGQSADRLAGQPVVAGFFVSVEHPRQLTWRPSCLPIAFDSAAQRGRGRLFIWGPEVRDAATSISHIECDGYKISFSTVGCAADGVIADMEFDGNGIRDAAPPDSGAIKVVLASERAVSVPYRMVRKPHREGP